MGEAPKLPETVKSKLSDGNETALPVRWDGV
ncbi:Ig-like domain-containing protein [Clostridium estertheticum]|nr:Ig-like domain-containing protein [Clostridium estertheticum]